MFKREVKKQFNSAKYKYLPNPVHTQDLGMHFRSPIMAAGAVVLAFTCTYSYTKRWYEVPHHHKDESQPMLMPNGELHPNEVQPPSAEGIKVYSKHLNE
mmetsp:Transcript_27687/g.24510  ORF Transcript_27687/g.24510 Transcript_27687/m.24510 type:complete len:99 (+) Transcript_27687:31-327(+)